MKMNYPIVYAVMPIIEQSGWVSGLNELEKKCDITCYITTKCYLISEKTIYTEDGKTKIKYEVVFPYQESDFVWKYEVPSYNLINGQCINSNYVDEIFESYEMAINYKNKLNKELCEKTWINLPYVDTESFKENVYKKEKEFYDKLSKYELLEKQILINVSELDNGKRKNLDYVIMNNGKILSMNLYQFMSFFHDSKYLVYSIDKEQYDLIVNKLDESKEIKTNFSTPILLCDSIISRLISDNIKGCYYVENKSLKYSEKISEVTNDEIKNVDEDTIVIYTTETVEDIIGSFKKYEDINLSELAKENQGPLLTKKIKYK